MCIGFPSLSLSFTRFHSFLAITELAYVCISVPRLLTTSAALYGLFTASNRSVFHHASTSCICRSYRARSAAPGLEDSARSWNEVLASVLGRGGVTVDSADMFLGVIDSLRACDGIGPVAYKGWSDDLQGRTRTRRGARSADRCIMSSRGARLFGLGLGLQLTRDVVYKVNIDGSSRLGVEKARYVAKQLYAFFNQSSPDVNCRQSHLHSDDGINEGVSGRFSGFSGSVGLHSAVSLANWSTPPLDRASASASGGFNRLIAADVGRLGRGRRMEAGMLDLRGLKL